MFRTSSEGWGGKERSRQESHLFKKKKKNSTGNHCHHYDGGDPNDEGVILIPFGLSRRALMAAAAAADGRDFHLPTEVRSIILGLNSFSTGPHLIPFLF